MVASHRGRNGGLAARQRTVLGRLDETSLTATPPLYQGSGRRGAHGWVPLRGTHARRLLPGVLTIWTGERLLLSTEAGGHLTPHAFLQLSRAHGRGWPIVRFADRGAPPTADERLYRAKARRLAIRFLPKATPELNALDQRGRQVKGRALLERAPRSSDDSAARACRDLLDRRRRECRRTAGGLSAKCWVTTGQWCERTF